MSLSVQTLKDELKELFDSMQTDEEFSDGVSTAFSNYFGTASVTTIDGGEVTGGTFAGAGTGDITTETVSCSETILQCCNIMKTPVPNGDDLLAVAIATGLQLMSSTAVVSCTVIGTVTAKGGVTSSLVGISTGTISCDNTPIAAALLECFHYMSDHAQDEGFDANQHFIDTLAPLVDTFIKTGIIQTSGMDVLSGSSGSGLAS